MTTQYFKRIGDELVEDMEKPDSRDYYDSIHGYFKQKDWDMDYAAYNSRPRYPINPSDLDKFKEGESYEEGKDFHLMKDWGNSPVEIKAFSIIKDNDMSKEDEQDALWNDVYFKIVNWDKLGSVLKQELKSKYTLTPKTN